MYVRINQLPHKKDLIKTKLNQRLVNWRNKGKSQLELLA